MVSGVVDAVVVVVIGGFDTDFVNQVVLGCIWCHSSRIALVSSGRTQMRPHAVSN